MEIDLHKLQKKQDYKKEIKTLRILIGFSKDIALRGLKNSCIILLLKTI